MTFKKYAIVLIIVLLYLVSVFYLWKIKPNKNVNNATQINNQSITDPIDNYITEVKKMDKKYIEINQVMQAKWSGCHFHVFKVGLNNPNEDKKYFSSGPCGVHYTIQDKSIVKKNGDIFVDRVNQKAKENIIMNGYYRYGDISESIYCEILFEDGSILIWDNGDVNFSD